MSEISFILYCLTLKLPYETITTLLEQTLPITLRSVTAIGDKARSLRDQYDLNHTEGLIKGKINLPKTKEFLSEFLKKNKLKSPELMYGKIPYIFYIFLISSLTLVEHINWPSPRPSPSPTPAPGS